MTVKPNKNTEAKRMEIIPRILLIVTVLLNITVLILLWKIANHPINGHKSLEFLDDLQNYAIIADEGKQDGVEEDEEIDISAAIDFDSLHETIDGIVAWLFGTGTKILFICLW